MDKIFNKGCLLILSTISMIREGMRKSIVDMLNCIDHVSFGRLLTAYRVVACKSNALSHPWLDGQFCSVNGSDNGICLEHKPSKVFCQASRGVFMGGPKE